jgi:hypothetical protein
VTAGTGDPEDLTGAQAAGILPVIRHDAAQSLTHAQKVQALTNMCLLASADVTSAVASVDFTLPVGLGAFMLLFERVQGVTADAGLRLRLSSNGGATFYSGSSDYSYIVGFRTGASYSVVSGNAAEAPLARAISKPSAFIGASGQALITKGSATARPYIQGRSSYVFGGVQEAYDTDAYLAPNVEVNALRLLMTTGNIESGKFRLYGVPS